MKDREKRRVDVSTFEVLRRKFVAICNEAGAMLERAAFSPAITEGRDFSGTLLTGDGRMVAYGLLDLPSHVGTFETGVQNVMRLTDEINDGDIIIFNDPYYGGTHLIDVRLAKPVFHKDECVAWYMTLGHWSDIGGAVPGGFKIDATESYEEGLNIPPIKLAEGGKLRKDIVRLITNNVRVPELCYGDLMAEVKAVENADLRVKEMFQKYGSETVKAVYEDMFDYSENLLRQEIQQLPGGTYESEEFLDYDPGDADKRPVRFHAMMEIHGSDMTFDLTKSDPAPKSATGAARASTLSATFTAIAAFYPEISHNHGMLRHVKVLTKPGTCVDIPHYHPCSGVAGCAFEKVLFNTTKCLSLANAKRNPETLHRVVCSYYNLMNLTVAGKDLRFNGRPYIMYLWTEGGYGASGSRDGNHMIHTLYASGSRNQSVEVLESWFPIYFNRVKAPDDDSGIGHGEFRSGAGIEKTFTLRNSSDAKAFVFGDKNKFAPWGFKGGLNASANNLIKNVGRTDMETLGVFGSNIPIKDGDSLTLRSQGGGGLGSPLCRDPRLVLIDVVDGWISKETARDIYGVILKVKDAELDEYEVDYAATNQLRKSKADEFSQRTSGLGPRQKSPYGLEFVREWAKFY